MNELTNKREMNTLIKIRKYFTRVIFIFSGAFTGRFLRIYFDYKAHPAMYSAPYPSWLEELKFDFLIYGAVILTAIIIVFVLKMKERNKMG